MTAAGARAHPVLAMWSDGTCPCWVQKSTTNAFKPTTACGTRQTAGQVPLKSCLVRTTYAKHKRFSSEPGNWKTAEESSQRAKRDQKIYYDRTVRGATLTPGDQVLVRQVAFDRPHKLADKWSSEMYEVIRQPDATIPVIEAFTNRGVVKIF
ncbi:Pol polyprotein [Elysia marginata]|uniref:Pol polyprotein n=1 Tax=Elysia marginata TaxID=1093978 RepID=A0AAV4EM69_9GAST|nr:Pol polyprotein [Elysia marginata]